MKITVRVGDIKIVVDDNYESSTIKYKEENTEVIRTLNAATNEALRLLTERKK